MLNKITAFVERHHLLSHDAGKYIVALSGGADSVALLLVLNQLGYDVEAAHCNFRLRGEESDRDEQFVRSLCERLQVQLHLIHFDTKTYADIHQVSIEMAARELRYRYFEQLRQDIGAEDVCVAHHQDDAVETLLMNLIRGTGIHGLTGIRPRNGHIVRPLLCVTRAEIVRFLDSLHQPYVTDSTNLVPDVVRNKIRLEVLPLLQQINPAATENIARTARWMSEAEKVYNDAFNISLFTSPSSLFTPHSSLFTPPSSLFTSPSSLFTSPISTLLTKPSPECFLFELLTPHGFTSSQVEQVFDALKGPSGRVFHSPTHELLIDRDQLIIEERREPFAPMRIPESGLYRLPDGRQFRAETSDEVAVSRDPHCATLDASKVRFPLTLRTVQTGDRFQPYGMKGTRLVSDYLTDRKRTLFEKRRQLVVTDAQGEILWLVGERVAHCYAVTDATRSILRLSFASTAQ